MPAPIENVADTALWVANYRAIEDARADALFRDPLAARLVAGRGREIFSQLKGAEAVGWSVLIRTVVIDRFILEAVNDGVDAVLNLGAGLDTRPYRLELPAKLRWVEADFATTISFKEARLQGESARCELRRVGVDLADTSARRALLHEVASSSKRVLVLTEGVVPYLTNEHVAELAADLFAEPTIERWVVEHYTPLLKKMRERAGFTKQLQNAPFLFEPERWVEFFSSRGWVPQTTKYLAIEAAQLGRPPPWQDRLLSRLFMKLMPKAQREALEQMSGYSVLMRPRPPSTSA